MARPIFRVAMASGDVQFRRRARSGQQRTRWIDFEDLPTFRRVHCEHGHRFSEKVFDGSRVVYLEEAVVDAAEAALRVDADRGLLRLPEHRPLVSPLGQRSRSW
ncbi:MAG: hypothetical protein ACLFWH_15105 [Actinomycetota bacterium]